MLGRAVAAVALCVVSQAALAQYAPQPQFSAVGTGKTFCSRYDEALTIANRTAGQPYQRPPADCFAVSPDVTVTILQSYPKLQSGGAIWQVQLRSTAGFLAFSLAPSIPPVASAAKPAAKVAPSQSAPSARSAPATKPSGGTFPTILLGRAKVPSAPGEPQQPTTAPAAFTPPADGPKAARETAKSPALSAADIALLIVQESRQQYYATGHPCACPEDVNRAGRSCGRTSAYSRPGGAAPLCYVNDVSSEMIARYRAKMAQTAAVQ
jgi:hypothetical protein